MFSIHARTCLRICIDWLTYQWLCMHAHIVCLKNFMHTHALLIFFVCKHTQRYALIGRSVKFEPIKIMKCSYMCALFLICIVLFLICFMLLFVRVSYNHHIWTYTHHVRPFPDWLEYYLYTYACIHRFIYKTGHKHNTHLLHSDKYMYSMIHIHTCVYIACIHANYVCT